MNWNRLSLYHLIINLADNFKTPCFIFKKFDLKCSSPTQKFIKLLFLCLGLSAFSRNHFSAFSTLQKCVILNDPLENGTFQKK